MNETSPQQADIIFREFGLIAVNKPSGVPVHGSRMLDDQPLTLLALYPETGRRHQLRMHMKHISHHLVGDTSYGRGEHNRLFREQFKCRRLLLHAWLLEIQHPLTGRPTRINAPLDESFGSILKTFSWEQAIELL